MVPTLETERLILREPRAEDFPVYRSFLQMKKHRTYTV